MYHVQVVGIVYFNVCTTEPKVALVPNGTQADGHIPQHNASFFIEEGLHDSDTWWRQYKFVRPIEFETDRINRTRSVNLLEFRIPSRAEITFDCDDTKLETVDLDTGLPQLSKVDPRFDLDLEDPDIIARFQIPGGKLQAFQFGDASIVRWTISKHSGPITITARTAEETKRITLKSVKGDKAPEIVFSNTIDMIGQDHSHEEGPGAKKDLTGPGHGHDHAGGHFVLYAKINKGRDERGLENPELPDVTLLQELEFEHPYLRFLLQQEQIPLPGCVPTCCAKPQHAGA